MSEDVFLDQFIEARPRYEKLCEETKRIILESAEDSGLNFQNISARAKTIDSFTKKAAKQNVDQPKYKDPLNEIKDLAGVRIITYTLKDLEKVDRFIVDNFYIDEKRDVGEERYKEGKFGYQSIHYLVRFKEDRLGLAENKKYVGLTCEIQIRTVLQHAWAEIEHDIQYKNQSDVPRLLQRKFIALAGLLEIADREFQSIQDEDLRLKNDIDEQLQNLVTRDSISSDPEDSEITVAELVRSKRYADAIVVYDKKISVSPNMHTLYLGRARAKFLLGDQQGALNDIEMALELNPDDDVAVKLRDQVLEGQSVERPNASSLVSEDTPNDLTRRANQYIEVGDGISAFELCSKAQDGGASKPFSNVNKAIACFVASDFKGASYYLTLLRSRLGTPMSVTICAMHCLIAAAADGERLEERVAELAEALNESDEFNFSMSPLAKLRRGIVSGHVKIEASASTMVEHVFSLVDAT